MSLKKPRFQPQIATAALCLMAVTTVCSAAVMANEAVDKGAAKAVTCAACHGQDGKSVNPAWPHLAGQHQQYLSRTLHAYQDGARQDVLMSGQAITLTPEDIENLAAYFASQSPARGTADAALVAAGERLYRGGNKDSQVSACIACHGPTGRGNPPAAYPSLAGQHAPYTAAQLRAYSSDARKSDDNQVMRNIASLMSEEEIIAVASYIQGLR